MTIKAIFLDAANTLVHKPALYPSLLQVLRAHGIDLAARELTVHHRFLSEATAFPDRTSRSFYDGFNGDLLRSFGITAQPELLQQMFDACTYLRWEAFADVACLAKIRIPLGILSNWNTRLSETLANIPDLHFKWVLGSEEQGLRKPDPAFFQKVLVASELRSHEIVYIGDSVRLDIEPALKLGFHAALIDRDDLYPHSNVLRLTSLTQITSLL